jgi:hypothetical protein
VALSYENPPTSSIRNGGVDPAQRFTHGRSCPICHGSDDERRGSGERCYGFLSDDGQWAHCTREDHAGLATVRGGSGTYAHLLKGKCPCGTEHAPADPRPKRSKTGRGRIAKIYPYTNAAGLLLFEVVRTADPKGFYQRRPTGTGNGRVNGLGDVVPVPYRLAELAAADPIRPVYLPEGEKDVDALAALGLIATCNPMGAGNWRAEYAEHFVGRYVLILPDNDPPEPMYPEGKGRNHAQAVARSLFGKAASVKVVELPDLPEKGDVSDWLAKGGTIEALDDLSQAAPIWKPPPSAEAEADDTPRFAGGFDTESKGRLIIRVTPDIHISVFDAAKAMARHPDIFIRGGTLARVIRHEGSDDDAKGVWRDSGSPMIATISADVAGVWLSASAQFQKYDRRSKDWLFMPPPRDLAAAVLGLRIYPGGRELAGVIEAPTLRPDGTLLNVPGYDPATGLLYVPNAVYPVVKDRPTLDDAKLAAAELLDLVVDFPFVGQGQAAFLAAMLTPIARFAIDGPCPLFLFDSPVSGSGKTLLCDLIAVVATGRIMARSHYVEDDEEMSKIITAVVLAGDRMMLFDNVETTLGSAPLDAALTGRRWKQRILGRSEMTPELPLNVVWFATGINVALGSTQFRRTVTSRIEPKVERPEERGDFMYPDVVATAQERRPRLLAAALTVLRAYDVAGRPDQKLTPFASYGAWSSLVRNAVNWVKGSDPCANRDELRAADAKIDEAHAVITGWAELPGSDHGLTAAEALDIVAGNPAGFRILHEVFSGWSRSGLPGSRAIGNRVKKYRGRVVGKFRFETVVGPKPAEWRVRPI